MKKQLFRFACLAVIVLAALGSGSVDAMWRCCGGKPNKVLPVDQMMLKKNIGDVVAQSKKKKLGRGDARKLQNWVRKLERDEDYVAFMQSYHNNIRINIDDDVQALQQSANKKSSRYVVLKKKKKRVVIVAPTSREVFDRDIQSILLVDQDQLDLAATVPGAVAFETNV